MNLSRFILLGLVLALAGLVPRPAKACGGFFCNNAQPVNQAAERIIFAQNADGTTTAIIEIQYEGPSEEFAWMLPVQGSPDIAVSSTVAFNALQNATNPSYQLTTRIEGECDVDDDLFAGGRNESADAGFMGFDQSSPDPTPPPVTVVDSGSVGPYDFVIINVSPDAEDIGAVATDWLVDNGYDVSELGRDRLVPYLESGMNLLAFRLSKGRNAGEIRPVRLSFGEGLPSIPLRPTAAAATPDMGILVWVLGETRAVPANYRDLELNEARLNWFNPFSNYNDLVTAAANEAGGQGFVTEMAGNAATLEEAIFSAFQGERFAVIEANAALPEPDHGSVLRESSIYGSWDGYLDVVRAEIPKPEGISDEEWIQNTGSYLNDLVFELVIEGFDPVSFVERLEAEVIAPVRETAELFTADRTMTRFFTTMSPDEMTVDPVFDFNADLPDYSNVHTRERVIECTPAVTQSEAPWRVEFEDGLVVRGRGFSWPAALQSDDVPANTRVRRIGSGGTGEIITDNGAAIAAAIDASNVNFPPPPPGGGDDGCSAGGTGGSLASLLLLAFFARRRRD